VVNELGEESDKRFVKILKKIKKTIKKRAA